MDNPRETGAGRPADDALRRSEERYRALVEATSQAVWSWSLDGSDHDFSQTRRWWAELTGQPVAEQETSGDAWLAVVHPDDRAAAASAWETAIQSGVPYDIEYRVQSPTGDWKHVHARGVPIAGPDGAVREWVGTLDDVTDRRRAEAEARASDAQLRRLASAGIIGVIRWNLDRSLILDANDEFLRMTGYDRADLAAGRLDFRAMTPPEWTGRNEVGVRELRRTGVGGAYEKEYFRKDGSRVPVIIVGVRFEDAANEGMSFVLDITDRKAMEKALRESDRRKDDFIALLAHELRNPLAPIRNGLQVMRLAGEDADSAAEAQAMMERQLGHMVRLIDDLLDVSRISRNKMELRFARILLADVVRSAVETARPLLDAAGLDLAISLPDEPVPLDADLTRLAQVFGNLLANSAKYTGRGGSVRVAAQRREGSVVVTVRDNGAGIPADSIASIFDMFSQVDRPLERSSGGLGIGLALVKGLVEMHGGTVTAESAGEGLGSTFTVTLPVPASPAPAAAAPPECDPAAKPKRRILVVDDNRDAARSMAMMLRLMGNEVRVAHDGVEAIDAAALFLPEVVLMDVGMPRLNGYDATRRIRAQPWGRDMAVVALTGWGQQDDRERSREAGCDGHLVKPVDPPDLERMLDSLRRSAATELHAREKDSR